MAELALLNPEEQEAGMRATASNILESEIATSHHSDDSTLDAVIGEYLPWKLKIPAHPLQQYFANVA